MRGPLGYLKSFIGDGIVDRERPNRSIGMAFLAAAAIVAFVGFRWMGSGGGRDLGEGGWTLGGTPVEHGGPTTIPASPAAVAVRIDGEGRPVTGDPDAPGTPGSTLPDGTPIDVSEPGATGSTGSTGSTGTTGSTGSTGSTSGSGGGSTTTVVTTVESTAPTVPTTPPTEPSTTAPTIPDTTTSTTEVPPGPLIGQQSTGLASGLAGIVDSILGS